MRNSRLLITPYPHQLDNVMHFHLNRYKSADWSDCGIWKSLIALLKFDALWASEVVDRLLVVCPLSVMNSWYTDIKNQTSYIPIKVVGNAEQKISLLKGNGDIFLITYDSIVGKGVNKGKVFLALCDSFEGKNMIILDEATMIKSWVANRTQALDSLCKEIKYSMFLSGTFMPQNIEEIFTIYRLMDGGQTFGDNIYSARAHYMEDVSPSEKFKKWVLKKETQEEFQTKLYENAFRLRKEDCLSLPEKVKLFRYSQLSEEQLNAYNSMRSELHVELDNATIDAKNVLTKLEKLQQITSGFIYDTVRGIHRFPCPKYGVVKEVLEQVPDEKALIFCKYRAELTELQKYLTTQGIESRLIHGSLSEKQRANAITEFRGNTDRQVMIAQQETGGYGLTLGEGNHIVY